MPLPTQLTHIQGLRGAAILLVFLYHLCPNVCPNGYYGVDLFLVISGYFLFKDQFEPKQDFKVRDFCKKKILRLLPPVFFTISLTLLIAIAFLPAIDMVHVYMDAKNALMFITNIQINSDTNTYFSADIRSFSLMHLWYISVFIQALAFFAFIFFIWQKFNISKKYRIISITIIGIASLAVQCQYILPILNSSYSEFNVSTYCWTTARIWELILGGLLVLIPHNKNYGKYLTTCFFCLLILLSFIPFNQSFSTKLIPLVTCLSGFLVVSGAHTSNSSLLNSFILTKLGTYSYSIYLIHWPVIWISEYLFNHPLAFNYIVITISIIIPLSLLIYQLFEKKRDNLLKLIIVTISAPLLAILILKTNGFKNYIRIEQNKKIETYTDGCDKSTPVAPDSYLMANTNKFVINLWGKDSTNEALLYHMGDIKVKPNFVLLGDSHARHYRSAFDYFGKIHQWSGIYLNSYIYPFWKSAYIELNVPDHEHTREKEENLINWLKEQPSIQFVILSNFWSIRYVPHKLLDGTVITESETTSARTEQLRNFCIEMNKIGKNVIILADTPSIKEKNPLKIRRKKILYNDSLPIDYSRTECTLEQYIEENKKTFETFDKLEQENLCTILRPHTSLFDNGVFSALDSPILGDTNHLTGYGARKALEALVPKLKDILLKQ